jgi:site-specific DNA recombinase
MNSFADTNTSLRIALCARVSDEDKQGDNYSAPDQLDKMRVWCLAQGWIVAPEHELTEKDSAFIEGLDRPELKKLLELAQQKKIDALMFYRSDRFTRDAADGVVLRRQIKKYGARLFFYSPTPREITSDMELINILEDYVSQRDAEKRREDSMRGYASKVKDGVFSQGVAPYGYKIIGQKREAHLEIVPRLAKIRKQISDWHTQECLGPTEIARRLTEARAPTPGDVLKRKRTRKSCVWHQSTVLKLLKDETYCGTWYAFRLQKIGKQKCIERPRSEWVPIQVPAIISRAQWELSQQRIGNRGDHPRNVRYEYLMRRRLDCICGYSVQGRPRTKAGAKTTLYYRCTSCCQDTARGSCGAPNFRVDDVDAEVWAQTKELLTNPGDVLRAYKEAQERQTTQQVSIREQISIIDEQIAGHYITIDNLLDSRKGIKSETLKRKIDADADRIADLIDNLTKRRATLEQQVQETTITDDHITSVVEKLKEARALIAEAEGNPQAQRKLIEFLNLRAVLRTEAGDRWVDIKFLLESYSRRVGKQESARPLTTVTPAPARSPTIRRAASRP